MLHRLVELDGQMRQAYADFDYKRIFALLSAFMTVELSAFYFDIRKDALYCDPDLVGDPQGGADGGRLSVPVHGDLAGADAVLHLRGIVAVALPGGDADSVHLEGFPEVLPRVARRRAGREVAQTVRGVRRVVTGALELERANKRIGSSLEAAPTVYVSDAGSVRRAGRCRSGSKSASRRTRRWSKARGRPRRSA